MSFTSQKKKTVMIISSFQICGCIQKNFIISSSFYAYPLVWGNHNYVQNSLQIALFSKSEVFLALIPE